jgi:hypothetical protein
MAFENRYSILDRVLHWVAFLTWPAQTALSDLEDSLFKRRLAGTQVEKPVFITALPRAGTTLLLEMCVKLEEFASHCYRDMPFVLIPMLWDCFAGAFRQANVPRERAHGDGMLVGVDSPEAFEEVVWKAFWPQHYKADRIVSWSDETEPDFSEFLHSHMRKIIALRHMGSRANVRYISKNNCNIARLGMLRRSFPDAVVVVPFRHPLQHAASLLRQHQNFLEIHRQDRFARDYMAAIGHYDFGKNLRPIDLGGWLVCNKTQDPNKLSFWVEYWVAVYGYLLKHAKEHVWFLSYDALCEKPVRALNRLADVIEIRERGAFVGERSRIIPAKPHAIDDSYIEPKILRQANDISAELRDISII